MAEWKMNGDAAALADLGGQGGSGGEVREGVYSFVVESWKEEKTMAGADKFSATMKIVAQDDGGKDMIGLARTQHFVIGHAKEAVAASYRADVLALLRAMGASNEQLNNCKSQQDVYMLGYMLKTNNPVVKYYVRPQAKDPKYLDWKLVVAPSGAVETSSAPTQAAPEKDPLFG